MTYYCITGLGCHVYYSSSETNAIFFRDRFFPGASIWQTEHPHTHGWAHSIEHELQQTRRARHQALLASS